MERGHWEEHFELLFGLCGGLCCEKIGKISLIIGGFLKMLQSYDGDPSKTELGLAITQSILGFEWADNFSVDQLDEIYHLST